MAIQERSPVTILSVLSWVMLVESSAIVSRAPVLSGHAGLWWGLVGVTAFSFTVPFSRVAVRGLSPLFIGSARAVVAALLAEILERLQAAESGS